MKKILSISLLGMLLMFTACNKFLDIYPDDKLIQEQVLNSEYSINYVLNGIYMNMAGQNIYGANLSSTVVEVLAQRYDVRNTENPYNVLSTYKYLNGEVDDKVNAMFDAIWTTMYAQILAINDFIDVLDKTMVNIPDSRKNVLYGEAYALRALHHFDLLRLFGPVPTNTSKWTTDAFMPYNNISGTELQELKTADSVMIKIFEDLTKAEELLANDLIKTQGVNRTQTLDLIGNFYTNRHLRMNYYAVKALQARAYLWINKKPQALEAANIVIDAQKDKGLFPWLPSGNSTRSTDPDCIFSTELIFGLYSQSLYTFYNNWFAPGLEPKRELCPNATRLNAIYDDKNDYRYIGAWKQAGGSKDYRTCYKYARPENLSTYDTIFAYIQPMIRISEMYYIAAECETPENGAKLLMDMREARGITTVVASTATGVTNELLKEYRKEFFGEGQLFYYYKRRNPTVPNGNATTGNVTLTAGHYELPLPKSETNMR